MKTGFLDRITILLAIVLLAACASPRLSAEMEAGKMAFQSGNYPKAFHVLLPVAKAGRPEAQYAVGYMYYYGYGVPRDLSNGMHWISQSAAQHYAPATQALERIRQESAAREATDAVMQADRETLPPAKPMPATQSAKKKGSAPKTKKGKRGGSTAAAKATGALAVSDRPKHNGESLSGQNACAGDASRYVLQLYGSWQYQRVTQVRKQLGLNGRASVCVTQRDGKNWYVLVTGEYATMPAAKKAKAVLSPRLKAVHPWIRESKGLYAADL